MQADTGLRDAPPHDVEERGDSARDGPTLGQACRASGDEDVLAAEGVSAVGHPGGGHGVGDEHEVVRADDVEQHPHSAGSEVHTVPDDLEHGVALRCLRQGGGNRPRGIIKKGEHGALLFQEDSCFLASAFPLEHVKDPTGAGDSFAGGLMGYLDQADSHDKATFRQAVIMGSTVASFCCEDFGVERLLTLTQSEITDRFHEFASMVHFDRL